MILNPSPTELTTAATDALLAALPVGGDRLLTLSSVVARQSRRGRSGQITYGLSYNLTNVFDAPANRSQQLGVVVSRQFSERRFGLPAPTLGGRVAYYVSDPSRHGQLTVQAGVSVGIGQ